MALSDKQKQDLVADAVGAKEKAYAKYSNFPVGAALLCHDGTVITGIKDLGQRSLSLCSYHTWRLQCRQRCVQFGAMCREDCSS